MSESPRNKRRVPIAGLIVAGAVVLAVGGLVWLVIWAMGRDSGVSRPSFEDNRTPWESAMAKASVEATFPGGPVDLARVEHEGGHSFEATFTPEELAALLSVYRYAAPQADGRVSLQSVSVGIPRAGWISIAGSVVLDGAAYSAQARGPVSWDGSVEVDEDAASVTLEGFSVDGARKEQAVRTLEDYLTAFIRVAPGLVVREATVTADGVAVKGQAPVRIKHPEPLER